MGISFPQWRKLYIPTIMNAICKGEGPCSFPSFFLAAAILLALSVSLHPGESSAQKRGDDELSRFDRLAEEATLLNKRGRADEVLALLKPFKEDKKNNSALFFNELGVAYRQKGTLPEAVHSYQRALSLDPENPVIMKNLADVYYLQKEYSKAAEQCQKALRSNPRFHQAHSTLGQAYYRLGKYQEALEEFETVLRLKPQDEQALSDREAARKKLQEKK